ncbi:MAG: type III pantothenate kinase [Planctomycetes bacterium]|nr:type III pantothenate kinase [Planctomycetota bacterium]
MLVAVDLGNSAIKFGAFDGARLVASERVDSRRSLAEDVIPPSMLSGAADAVALASSPARAAELAAWSPRPIRVLGDEVRAAFRTSYDRPSELGLDRIAAMAAARELTGGGAVAVVSVGTAVTVDILDRDGRFLAVAIAPGLRSAADGLHAAAPHLPYPSIEPGATRVPARGSADSLRNGHVLGLAGLVDRLLDEAAGAAGGPGVVILTGGDAQVVAQHLRTVHRVEPHLVLHGIRILHTTVCR